MDARPRASSATPFNMTRNRYQGQCRPLTPLVGEGRSMSHDVAENAEFIECRRILLIEGLLILNDLSYGKGPLAKNWGIKKATESLTMLLKTKEGQF